MREHNPPLNCDKLVALSFILNISNDYVNAEIKKTTLISIYQCTRHRSCIVFLNYAPLFKEYVAFKQIPVYGHNKNATPRS